MIDETCPHGITYDSDYAFCPDCNTRPGEEPECIYCGDDIDNWSGVCPACAAQGMIAPATLANVVRYHRIAQTYRDEQDTDTTVLAAFYASHYPNLAAFYALTDLHPDTQARIRAEYDRRPLVIKESPIA